MFFPKKDMDRSRIMHFFGRGGGVLNFGSNHDTPSGHKQLLCEIGTSNGFFKRKIWTGHKLCTWTGGQTEAK